MSKYFFLHIPKTAGTSFRKMLNKQFSNQEIFPNERLIKQLGGYPFFNELEEKYKEKLAMATLLVGHYPFSAYKSFCEDTELLSFYREPVQRVISFLNYYKSVDKRYIDSSFEMIFEKEIGQISNVQVKMTSGIYNDRNQSRVDIAIQNLKKLDFIGLSEDFENSVRIAELKFGWNLGKIKKVNITPSKSSISSVLIQKIIDYNAEDLIFYEEVKRQYALQCEKYLTVR